MRAPVSGPSQGSLAELADGAFVGLLAGSGLQAHITQQARRLGQRLNYRIRLRSVEWVCRRLGEGIVPQAVALRHARAAKIGRIALTDAWAALKLMLCVRDFDALPVPAQQLVRHLLAHSA